MSESPRRVAVAGAAGQMGLTVCAAVLAADGLTLVAAVDPAYAAAGDRQVGTAAVPRTSTSLPPDVPRFDSLDQALSEVSVDVVVDFTRAEAARANLPVCLSHHVAAIVGTSGLAPQELDDLGRQARAAGTPILVVPNFAIGAVLMMRFAQQAAALLDACEIVELHHDRKLDAPSGTAKRTAEMVEQVWRDRGLDRVVPLHSVRLPGLVAHQETIFGSLGQTLTIRHDSISRESFMPGVVLAVRRVDRLEGLVVGLENIL